MTNNLMAGVVRRLSFVLFILAAGTSVAEPPAYPYFKIDNRTPFPIAGTFSVDYYSEGSPGVPKSLNWEVAIPARQAVQRNFPDRLYMHPTASKPKVDGAGPYACVFRVDGQEVGWFTSGGCRTLGGVNISVFRGYQLKMTVWVTSGDPDNVTIVFEWGGG